MENASKALIIAGAILLAILIISLGILIFNQASSVVNNNAMSEVEMQNFNQKFTQYEGTSVRGSTVRALYEAVLSNNLTNDSTDRQVEIVSGGDPVPAMKETDKQLPSTLNTGITTGSSYTVECTRGTSGGATGLVQTITITKN